MIKLKLKLEFYRANDGYRWRTVAENSEITGASTQGFSRLIDCRDNYRLVATAGIDDALAASDVSDERTANDPLEPQHQTPEN